MSFYFATLNFGFATFFEINHIQKHWWAKENKRKNLGNWHLNVIIAP